MSYRNFSMIIYYAIVDTVPGKGGIILPSVVTGGNGTLI